MSADITDDRIESGRRCRSAREEEYVGSPRGCYRRDAYAWVLHEMVGKVFVDWVRAMISVDQSSVNGR